VKRGILPVMAVVASVLALFLWLYIQFLVPRIAAPLPVKISLPVIAVFFTAVPFVGAFRGNAFEKRTESQQQWAHGAPYWVGLVVLVLLPFSRVAAGIAVALILVGTFCYVYLWRPKPRP
jgi:dolichol kinase